MNAKELLKRYLQDEPKAEADSPLTQKVSHSIKKGDSPDSARLIALEMSTNRCIPKDLEQLFNRAVTLGNKYTVSRVAEAIERALTTPGASA